MISIKHSGNFNKLEKFLATVGLMDFKRILQRYGEMGVEALAANTPVDTGKTASMWKYTIITTPNTVRVHWTNDNIVGRGVPIALLLQYGHGTGRGAYVVGQDYINPALAPIFDEIARAVWKEVTDA